jgi:hypothetical protein
LERKYICFCHNRKKLQKPDSEAEVKDDGIYLFGKKVKPSKGSILQPAMRLIQEAKNHRNPEGLIVSLNAYRQWHVIRQERFVPIYDLKDPDLARKRGGSASFISSLSLEDLGI